MAKIDLKPDSIEELSKGINPDVKTAPPEQQTQPEDAPEEKEENSNEETEPEKGKAQKKKRKLDEMTEHEAITLHAQRNTYSVERADKKTKEEIYASEFVFVEDGEDRESVDTEAKQRREEYLELVASADNSRILKGTIESVTTVDTNHDWDDPDYIPQFMAKVKFMTGKFVVKIPSSILYYYHYERMNKAMALNIQKNMMRRIGSEIDFVVRYVNEKEGEAIADRLASLSMRGVKYYTSQNGKKPAIIPGMIVQARIVALARECITVDAAGAEISIPLEEISWLYNSDAREFDGIRTEEKYQIGDTVNVKILSVDTRKVKIVNSSYTLIDAKASIKQAKPNPREKYYGEFRVGDIYAGHVTGITENGVYVNLSNKIDCMCKFPRTGKKMPLMGEQVIVQIFAKDDEKRFIYGNLR